MTNNKHQNKYHVHIISHTHWDREWYLNSRYTNEWLLTFFENLFGMLEKEKEYIFVLDGQTAMIEDYFEELDKRGINPDEKKEKIRKFVKERRLFIGPYYLQPDWQLLSEESLVRNLLIGNKVANDLGGRMETGWLLDNFGQISQTAQIHEAFGLKGLYVWRGIEMDPSNVHSEFLWESPDGTKIPSIYLLNSYRNVMRLAEYNSIMKQRVMDEVKKLKPFITTPNILLMNGYDQEMVPDDLQPYLKAKVLDNEEISVFQSNPEDYLEAVLKYKPDLEVLKGPLYSGRFIAVFPGVMSSRIYLKLQNDELQKYIEKNMEPLSSIVWALGGEYEEQIITETWKTLLKNHPHDSICGVSIDDVHTDMENRSRIVKQLAASQTRKKLEEIIGNIDTENTPSDRAKIVFNPSPYPRNEVISYNTGTFYVKNIPSLGFRTITVSDSPDDKLIRNHLSAENRYLKITINSNGSFNILHKETGIDYSNMGIFEDRADAGDEYNYSYPDHDTILTSENSKAEISIEEENDLRIIFKVKIILNLPESCINGYTERSTIYRKLPIVTLITLEADSRTVKCKTMLRNTVKDHILKVKFPTEINTEYSYAGSPFDITERPIRIKNYDESSIPEHVKKVIIGAREANPNTIFLNREFVDLNNEERGLAILSKGLPEYQVTGKENIIDLTLFRSVGWIAKDINSRIGDAGPEILTPGAQCLREMTFEYSVYPHKGNTYNGGVCRESDIFNTALVTLTTDRHKGSIKTNPSFFEISDSKRSFKLTALKRSEDGDAIIARGYNSGKDKTNITIKSFFTIQKAYKTDLLEKPREEIKINDNGSLTIKADPKKIITVRLEIKRKKYKFGEYTDIILINNSEKEDFSTFKYTPSVTETDLENETLRAETLSKRINDPAVTRTALEAQLSAILTRNRISEIKTRELGYKLNEARVQRRILDYINKAK